MKIYIIALAAVVLITLLCGCGSIAELTTVENVFDTIYIELPEDWSYEPGSLSMHDNRVEVVCTDIHSPDGIYEYRCYSVDLNGENPQIEVIPTVRDGAFRSGICRNGDGWCFVDANDDGSMLHSIASDGSVVFSVRLQMNDYTAKVAVGANGNIYVAGSGVEVYDPNGSLIYTESVSGMLDSLVTLPDGRTALCGNSNGELCIYVFDDEARGYGEKITIPTKLNTSGYDVSDGFGEWELCVSNRLGIYGYADIRYNGDNSSSGSDNGDEIAEDDHFYELCNYANSDINPSEVSEYIVISEDIIAAVGHTWATSGLQLMIMKRVPEDEVAAKQLVTLHVNNISQDMAAAVAEFNKQSAEYRVVVRDYSQYNTETEAFAAFGQLERDILAGDIPDVFMLDDELYNKYSNQGLFCDLYELIDSDDELSRGDFMSCVLKPLESEGRLYQLAVRFYIEAVVGVADSVASDGWDYERLIELYNETGELPFGDWTRVELQRRIFNDGIGDFIDVESGECHFDDGLAKELIELLYSVGERPEYDDLDAYRKRLSDKRARGEAFSTSYINDYEGLMTLYYEYEVQYGSLEFVGYPRREGATNYIVPSERYAIAADSNVKAGAWEFLKFLLSENTRSNEYYFPSLRESFERELAAAQDGIYSARRDSGFMLFIPYNKGYEANIELYGGDDYVLLELTDEFADKFIAMLDDIDMQYCRWSELDAIIDEELGYVWNGVRTPEECVELIQSRASLFVSERS